MITNLFKSTLLQWKFVCIQWKKNSRRWTIYYRIFCQKQDILVQQKNLYSWIIFPEADPGTLQNITWSTSQQDLTACGRLLHGRSSKLFWLKKQIEIEIIKLWVNSDKIIAWLRTNIPRRLKSQTASASWQYRYFFSVFIAEQFLHFHQTQWSQSFLTKMSRSVVLPSSILSWKNPSWMGILQTGIP